MDRGRNRGRRLAAGAAALALHGLLLLAVVQITPTIRQHFVTPATPVIIAARRRLEPPPPPPPPKPEPETEAPAPKGPPRTDPPPPPAAAPPPRAHLVATPEARPVPPRAPVQAAGPTLSDAEIAGALTAAPGDGAGQGGGGAGGRAQGCDMVRRLQRVLRADRQVQAAVAHAQSGGRPLIVWRGDWIQSSGEDGKGLAGLRQAIAMEVAFAPEACRAEPVRGVVLLSLSDEPGAARIALGAGTWRWSDLLFAQGVRRR